MHVKDGIFKTVENCSLNGIARNFCLGCPKHLMHFHHDSSMKPYKLGEGEYPLFQNFFIGFVKISPLIWLWLGSWTPGFPWPAAVSKDLAEG